MMNDTAVTKRYLVASDFDQTLSFNDSGIVLSEVVGVPGFHEKVVGLSKANLVQQGAELAYLLRHDPKFRGVRREHLIEAGKRVRLKITSIFSQRFSKKVSMVMVFRFMYFRLRHKMSFNRLSRGSFRRIAFLARSLNTMLRLAKFLPSIEFLRAMAKLLFCRNWKPSS
jgi:glycosyltransferase involved in cell wall biosynthesis